MLGERLKLVEATFVTTGFKLGKDGFVIRLPSGNEVIEDPGEFVSGVLGGLDSTVPCTLRPVIVAQVGLAVVKRLSR